MVIVNTETPDEFKIKTPYKLSLDKLESINAYKKREHEVLLEPRFFYIQEAIQLPQIIYYDIPEMAAINRNHNRNVHDLFKMTKKNMLEFLPEYYPAHDNPEFYADLDKMFEIYAGFYFIMNQSKIDKDLFKLRSNQRLAEADKRPYYTYRYQKYGY